MAKSKYKRPNIKKLAEGETEQQMEDALYALRVLGFTDVLLIARAIDHSVRILDNIKDGLVVEIALEYLNSREKSEVLPIPMNH